jgi:XTP/dITP diphosphohydrolase
MYHLIRTAQKERSNLSTFTAKRNGNHMQIVFASNNENKVREIRSLLGNSFELLSLKDLNIEEEIPENEPSLEGNAIYKARYVYNLIKMNVFADDTGLEIDVLNGMPGVHSARFAGEAKDPDANIKKALSLMGTATNRKARFRTVIALIMDGTELLFEGMVNGTIINEKRGTGGFGYDPVFIPDGSDLTFAQMPLSEKNLFSHRAKAFEKFRSFLDHYLSDHNKETK